MSINIKDDPLIQETIGGLYRTAALGFESPEDLLTYLKNKTVLDLGSGGGGFAKEAYEKLGNKTTIMSFNLRLRSREYKKIHQAIDPISTTDKEALRRYKQTAVAGNWKQFPLKKESFDCVFATGSFLFYPGTYDEEVWTDIIQLVKKDTGEVRVELGSHNQEEVQLAIDQAKIMGCKITKNKTKDGGYLLVQRGEK